VDDDQPVTLRVKITGGTFSYTPLHNDTAGTTLTYGPLTGTLDLAPGSPGGAPIVKLDGQPVTPHDLPPTPAPVTTPPPGVTTKPPGSSIGPARRLAISGRARLHDRTLKVKVLVPGAGSVRAVVRRKNGKRPALGSARVTSARAQTKTLTVRLRTRPRAPVRLTITYTPAKGASQNVSTSVKPR
jgi:hypothetical protein